MSLVYGQTEDVSLSLQSFNLLINDHHECDGLFLFSHGDRRLLYVFPVCNKEIKRAETTADSVCSENSSNCRL